MSTISSKRRQQFLMSATVDFPDDMRHGVYTHELLDELMVQLQSMGVRRVYWLYYGDVDPESYWAGSLLRRAYGPPTIDNIGEPLQAAVSAGHRQGLEVYGVLKPYDVGLSGTAPEGSPMADATSLKRIGGTVLQAVPFFERNPHTILRRRPLNAPPDLLTQPISKIRLLKMDDTPTRVRKENLEIWTSPINYRYEKQRVDFTLKEAIEPAPREARDSNGNVVTAKGAPVRTLTLEGLDLTDRYVLVTTNFNDLHGDFRNTALAMIEAYGSGPDPLPVVVATRSGLWESPRDFRTSGLEFDAGFGHYLADLDVDNTAVGENIRWRSVCDAGLIGFARGKNETLPCSPCEVYPEVRKLWYGWLDRMLETGVDGIAIRSSSHGTFTDEPEEYGFNDLVVEEYGKRYGADLLSDDADLELLAQMRGEYYTEFMRGASQRVRAAGKKIQIHMHPDGFRPALNSRQVMGFTGNIHLDWKTWLREGLADGSTMRLSRFAGIQDAPPGQARRGPLSNILADPVVEEMLTFARDIRFPIHLNLFEALVDTDEYVADMEDIFHDERFAGFDVYEVAGILNATPDGSELVQVGDSVERVRAKAGELGLLRDS